REGKGEGGGTVFGNAQYQVLRDIHDLFHAAHHAAEAHGYVTCCDNYTDDWPVEKAAEALLQRLEEARRANPGKRVALIADGELSCPVMGHGIGCWDVAVVLSHVE